MIIGPSGSGKTQLYLKLISKKITYTLTSTTVNVSTLNLENGSVNLVDIPGNEKVYKTNLKLYLHAARAIILIFRCDNHAANDQLLINAKFFMELIKHPSLFRVNDSKNYQFKLPILLLLSTNSKGFEAYLDELNNQINSLRETTKKSKILQSIDSNTTIQTKKSMNRLEYDIDLRKAKNLSINHLDCENSSELSSVNVENIMTWIKSI